MNKETRKDSGGMTAKDIEKRLKELKNTDLKPIKKRQINDKH